VKATPVTDERDFGRALDAVDALRDEIIGLSQTLVRFDSVNQPPWGNEGPCQAFVAGQLRELGLQVETFTPDEVPGIQDDPAYLPGRDYTHRPNVVGVLKGRGGGRSLHLAAHADVVPIGDRSEWTVEPFGGQIIDGKIYGRGAIDDKDGLSGILGALHALRRAGIRLQGDLIVSSSVDEEFAGGNGLLAVVRRGYLGDAAINCDGLQFLLWTANTGGGPFRILIQSRVDAPQPTPSMRRVQAACRDALTDLSREWRARYWPHPLYPPGTPWIMRKEPIEVKVWEEGLTNWNWQSHGPACGVGGYATTLPGQDRNRAKAEIVAAVERAYESCHAADVHPPRVEWVYRFMDACEVSAGEPIIATVREAYHRVTGQTTRLEGGPRSDLHMLTLHGKVPTVSFGVGAVFSGRHAAHGSDERIDIEGELIPYVKTLALAIIAWCG